ncbi:serine acetyltransferase [Clostridium perfringens]|uniref:serine acetyltransferase n=1 Tax=Clostridium perfringens TaxID=1502 RepID=UPI0024684BF0|nr:serine acetyltransferase [Clostridium perfringens]MDH5075731.1 Serine acetyltransferase [Clostridium perfringens]MDM0624607.1 serine acetyltransferase [Clostridium perfringens]
MLKIAYTLNCLRTTIVYIIIKVVNCVPILKQDIVGYHWYINANETDSFFKRLNRLLLRNNCFRNLVCYRVSQKNKELGYIVRLIFSQKHDLEIYGDIGAGLSIFHGHGTIINAHHIGENFSVYQGVTIGRNPKKNQNIATPSIGNNVTVYANAVVAGNIVIGDNVTIGAGSVVMKDVPSNSLVVGKSCIIKKGGIK